MVLEQIKDIVFGVIETQDNRQQSRLLQQLQHLFNDICDFQFTPQESHFGKTGLLLSAFDAGNCLLGCERTRLYWQALVEAIQLKKKQGQVRILYPGPGPFAALVLPVLIALERSDVSVITLEINPESAHYLEKLKTVLGFTEQQFTVVSCDATEYCATDSFDILISECLLAGLLTEGQVAITRHLSQFLSHSAVLIPASITVDLVVANMFNELTTVANLPVNSGGIIREYLTASRIFRVNLINLDIAIRDTYQCADDVLNLGMISLPQERPQGLDFLLATRIRVDNESVLEEYQNGLTMPVICPLSFPKASIKRVSIGFKLYGEPGFIMLGD